MQKQMMKHMIIYSICNVYYRDYSRRSQVVLIFIQTRMQLD